MKKPAKSRYRAKITVGHEEDGTPIYKYASGKTKTERDKNKEELRRRYINGAEEVDRSVQFNAYALEWFESRRQSLKTGMRKGYASALNKHLFPAFADRQLRAIKQKDLQTFLNTKAGYKPSTLHNIVYVLRETFQTALAEGVIDKDPSVKLAIPTAKKDVRRELTELETAAVLRVADENEEGLLLKILYFTGVRIGEALGLQWRDVDFDNAIIHVERDIDFYEGGKVDDVKTDCSVRTIPLPTPLLDALKATRGIRTAFILQAPRTGSSLSHSTLERRWKRLMRDVCVTAEKIIAEQREEKASGKRARVDPMIETKIMNPKAQEKNQVQMSALTPHYFRHNYASILYDEDIDVLSARDFLGHADVSTTLKIYAHLSKQKRAKKADSVRQAFDAIYKVAKRLPEGQKEALITASEGKEKS